MAGKILFGECPPPGTPSDFDKLGSVPSLWAIRASLGDPISWKFWGAPTGTPEEEHLELTRATRATPVLWVNGEERWRGTFVDEDVTRLGEGIAKLTNHAGEPQMCFARLFLEHTNTDRKYPKDAKTICSWYDRAAELLREAGCGPERMLLTADFCPAFVDPQDLHEFIPKSAQAVGLDLYTRASLDFGTLQGRRVKALAEAAEDRDLPLVVLESGIANPGMNDTKGAIDLADRLCDFVEENDVIAWMLSSFDWRKHATLQRFWTNGYLSDNPEVLAHLKKRISKMDIQEGPYDRGSVEQTLK